MAKGSLIRMKWTTWSLLSQRFKVQNAFCLSHLTQFGWNPFSHHSWDFQIIWAICKFHNANGLQAKFLTSFDQNKCFAPKSIQIRNSITIRFKKHRRSVKFQHWPSYNGGMTNDNMLISYEFSVHGFWVWYLMVGAFNLLGDISINF